MDLVLLELILILSIYMKSEIFGIFIGHFRRLLFENGVRTLFMIQTLGQNQKPIALSNDFAAIRFERNQRHSRRMGRFSRAISNACRESLIYFRPSASPA